MIECGKCRHYVIDSDGDELCLRDEVQIRPEVLNDPTPGNWVPFAEDMRKSPAFCGPAGMWFEPTTTN